MSDRCLDPQLLAAFAERRLKRGELPEVLEHLEHCQRCMSALKAATDLMEPRSRGREWLAAAAAIAVLVGAAPFAYRAVRVSDTERLVRLAPKSARVVEVRLTGGFAWAPYRGPMRSTDAATEAQRMKLVGAAGELVERAEAEKTAQSQHAAGIGLVLVEKPDDAIQRLRVAAESEASDARAWSDLAAAEYMTALRHGRASLYPIALAHADRALRIDPDLGEALFNRALILERLGLTQFARDAWTRYLAADPSSKWAEEARDHLKRLPAATGDALFRRDRPLLERAAIRGDQRAVDGYVDRYRQQTRTWGEAESLGRWGLGEDASNQLAIARAIGDALARSSGESLLRDAVACIDGANERRRATLAEAHAIYRRGRMTYSRREPVAAERDLRRAAEMFAAVRSPMALVARYFAANTRFDQNDVANARRELQTLLGETRHAALRAQIRWELALCAIADEDWSAAAGLSGDAAREFERLGESSNVAFMQAILATALVSLGRPDEGWTVRAKSFASQSGEARGDRLAQSLSDAVRVELRTGRLDAARALLALETSMYRAARDDAELSNSLVREALLAAKMNDAGDARRSAADAMTAASRVADAAFRARALADATFAAGAVAGSRDQLSQAIEQYRSTGNRFYIAEALLMRARASVRAGDAAAALRDLEEGIAAGTVGGSGIIDARRELLEESIALRLDRGDVAGAFADAERAQQRSDVRPLADVLSMLAGTDTAILEFAALPKELVAFCITADDITVSRQPAVDLASLDERRLYDLLIRPSARALASAKHLIVVADRGLQHIPFAALHDGESNRYLIETMSVALAPSAASLERAPRPGPAPSVLAIALPAGETNVALPEVSAELSDLRDAYRSIEIGAPSLSAISATRADVIHIAGHTERQRGAGDAALLFDEPATWSRIAAMKLHGAVVVLAACETLRASASPQVRTLSLGGGFLAAGATQVIGTLTPVADNEARAIFRSVHRELARGANAADALQRAQIEAIATRANGWQAVAVITNRIEGNG